jgi:hypothetical protein
VRPAAHQFLDAATLPGLLDRYGFALVGDGRALRRTQAELP